jgi:lipopolysaccharide export system permease protein
MKKLIFRKILKDILYFFLLISLSITLIVWVIQAVNFLDIVSEDGHGLAIYFKYTLLNIPKIFSRTLVFIFFVSVFYIILKYENNNELIVFWSNGVTKRHFVNIIILFSFLFLIIQMLFTSYVVPASQDKARSYIRSSNIDFFPSLLKEKKFIDTVSNLTIFIEEKKKNGILKKIFLKEDIGPDRSQTIYAKRGEIISANEKTYIKLYDGKIINAKNKKVDSFSFKETEIDLSKYKTKTTTYPKIQELSSFTILKCISINYANYFNFKKDLKINCQINDMVVFFQEFFKRFYMPLYIPLLALISSLLILKSKDNYRFNNFKNFIFIIGMAFIIFSEVTVRYFGLNIKSNIVFLFLPLILFFLIYSAIFLFGYKRFNK